MNKEKPKESEPEKAARRLAGAEGILDFTYAEVIPETVGQQVGLKDKNGKKIDWWEDDLLQSIGIDKRIGQITYDERYAEWRLYVDGNSWCSLAAAYYDGWKKVGNIHQHPNLLEQDNG